MIVTGVEPGRKGLSRVYIDGEFAFRLDTEVLALNRIMPGRQMDDEELHDLIQQSDARRASEKALYLLEYRSRSKKELRDKVARVAGKEAAQAAADRMEELGLVDDERYARAYAEELFDRKKFGAARVRQELYRKGIDREIIDQILAEYEEESQEEKIREILMRKYPGFREDEKTRRRAFAALQRMGYRYEEIRSALALEYDEY